MSTKYYFLTMDPDEDSYDDDEETVTYNITLTELTVNGEPATILQWFNALWEQARQTNKYEIVDNWVEKSLNLPSITGVSGLHSLYTVDEEDSIPKAGQINTEEGLRKYIAENLKVERKVVWSENALLVGTTMEFDIEYAFFSSNVDLQELGDYLPALITKQGSTFTRKSPTYVAPAYL